MKFYYIFNEVVDDEIEAVRLCKNFINSRDVKTCDLRNDLEKRGLPNNGQRKTLLRDLEKYENGLNINTLEKLSDYVANFGYSNEILGCGQCEIPMCLEIIIDDSSGRKTVNEWFVY